MLLTYNGVEIRLGPIGVAGTNTHAVSAEQKTDDSGVDFLYTRYTFDCVGVVNPASMSYVKDVGNPAPRAQAGTPAALTIAAILDALSQPRQLLTYADQFGNVLLQSPANNPNGNAGGGIQNNPVFPCDCTGGPFVVRAPELLKVHGDKTILVRVVIRTDVNQSFLATKNPPILLSNRWAPEETLDDCAFSTLTYRGTAVFRADVMATKTVNGVLPAGGLAPQRAMVPDDLRDYFQLVQIPAGYRRARVWTRQRADGFTVDWQVVDEQRAVTLNVFDAMDVEVVQIDGVESEGMEAAATATADLAVDLVAYGLDMADPFTFKPGDAARLARRGIHVAADAIPRWNTHVVITAKGHPGSSRQKLAKLCVFVLEAVVNTVQRGVATTNISLMQDKTGKLVRLTCDVRRGPAQTVLQFPTPGGGSVFAPKMYDLVPADDGVKFVPAQGQGVDLTSSAPGQWPPFPGDQGVRGTALEVLLAQALLNPYQAPPKPPAVTAAAQNQQPQ